MRRLVIGAALAVAAITGTLYQAPGTSSALGVLSGDSVSTVDFEAYPPGTQITNQYKTITFEEPSAANFKTGTPIGDGIVSNGVSVPWPVVTTNGPHAGAHAGALVIPSEFSTAGAFGALSQLADSVSVYMGDASSSGTHVELDAYGPNRQLLGSDQVVTTSAGAETKLGYSTGGTGEIAYVALYRTAVEDQKAVMDDLTISVPPVSTPVVGVATTTTTYEVGQGGTVQLPLTVTRVGNPTSPVTIDVSGIPPGVTQSLSVNPVALPAAQSVLTLTAASTMELGKYFLSLTASASGATSQAATVIEVDIVPPISVVVATPVQVGACAVHAVAVEAQVAPGLSGPVAFSATTVSPGLSPNLTPQQVPVSNGLADSNLSISSTGGSFQAAVVVAATLPGGQSVQKTVVVQRLGPQVTAMDAIDRGQNGGTVSGLAAMTPRAEHPGTTVEIYGRYFCDHAAVDFGNSDARVAAIVQHETGNQGPYDYIRVTTPRDATDGPVTVRSGSPAATATSAASLKVDSYRNAEAFNFANFRPSLSFEDLTNAFGSQQTYINVNACGFFTLGIANCSVAVVPDPVAVALLLVADATMSTGTCFGFSLTDQRLVSGGLSTASFAGSAKGIYDIVGPPLGPGNVATGNSPVLLALKADHLMQLSTEFLSAWATQAMAQSIAPGGFAASEIAKEITKTFAAGRYPMVELNDGNGGGGHVVVAYDLAPDGSGGYDIYVYDSNAPFTSAETTDAGVHAAAVSDSIIHLGANGDWYMRSTTEPDGHTPFQGGPGAIVVTDPAAVPLHPTLPTLGGIAPGLLFSSAAPPGAPQGAAGPAARVVQVSGAGGRSLYKDGHLDTDPATRLMAAPFAPLVTRGSPVEAPLFVLAKTVRQIHVTTDGTSSGRTTETFIGDGFVGTVGFSAPKAASETESFSASSGTVGYSGRVTTGVVVGVQRQGTWGTRSVMASTATATGGSIDLSVSGGSGVVTLRRTGRAATFDLTVSGSSSHGLPGAFATGPITVGAGESARISGLSWGDLAASRPVVGLGARHFLLHNKAATAKILASLHLSVAKASKKTFSFTIKGRLATAGDSRVVVLWALERGKSVLARRTTLASVRGRMFSSTWSADRRRSSGATVSAHLVAVVATGRVATSDVATRSEAIAVAK